MTCLAVDVGGTKIAAARVSPEGDIEGRVHTVATPAREGSGAVIDTLTSVVRRLDHDDVEVVGISSAGVIDSDRGVVLASTASICGWAGTELGPRLEKRLGWPVSVLGDGHAFAVGEAVYGAARDAHSLLLLAVGTGVGGSYVSGRRPLLGRHFAGGHVGHVAVPEAAGLLCDCGKYGHVEALGGGAGMVRWYRAKGGDASVDSAADLFRRRCTDPVAAAAIELGASAVGTAAGSLANAFDPEVVVVAGGLSQAGTTWEAPMRSSFTAALMPGLADMPLKISEPGAWLALRGAAYYAMTREERA